jgi:serine/threonine protein kinase
MLHHKYIVSYEDEFMHINEGPFDNKYIYIIIMEYCSNGDLTDKIRDYRAEMEEDFPNNCSMPEHKVMKYFIQVCEALKYIH